MTIIITFMMNFNLRFIPDDIINVSSATETKLLLNHLFYSLFLLYLFSNSYLMQFSRLTIS